MDRYMKNSKNSHWAWTLSAHSQFQNLHIANYLHKICSSNLLRVINSNKQTKKNKRLSSICNVFLNQLYLSKPG